MRNPQSTRAEPQPLSENYIDAWLNEAHAASARFSSVAIFARPTVVLQTPASFYFLLLDCPDVLGRHAPQSKE